MVAAVWMETLPSRAHRFWNGPSLLCAGAGVCGVGLRGERRADQCSRLRGGQHPAHAGRGAQPQQHRLGAHALGLGQQHRRWQKYFTWQNATLEAHIVGLKAFYSLGQTASLTSPSPGRGTRGWPYPPASEASFSVSLCFYETEFVISEHPTGRHLDSSPADMLFGVGLGCLVQMGKTQTDVQVSHTISSRVFRAGLGSRIICLFCAPQFEVEGLLTWILTGALGLSLVLSFITVPLSRFHLGRGYGIFLLIFYGAFLLVALLTEFGKIHLWL